jgi:hypothetical protein
MNRLFGFLYAEPSIVEGMARILDFGNTLTEYNCALSGEQADFLAMRADWAVVGDDIRSAVAQFAKDVEEELPAVCPG